VGQGPSGEVIPRDLLERPPCEVQRLGHAGGVDRGYDDDPDAVAALSCSASWRSNSPRMVPQQQPGAKLDHSTGMELELTRDRLYA